MPWNEADRVKYDVIRDRYSTDMSDAEFELGFARCFPRPRRKDASRRTSASILNALFLYDPG